MLYALQRTAQSSLNLIDSTIPEYDLRDLPEINIFFLVNLEATINIVKRPGLLCLKRGSFESVTLALSGYIKTLFATCEYKRGFMKTERKHTGFVKWSCKMWFAVILRRDLTALEMA